MQMDFLDSHGEIGKTCNHPGWKGGGGGGGEVLGPASSAPTAESHSLTGGSRLLPNKARLTMIEQATNQNP